MTDALPSFRQMRMNVMNSSINLQRGAIATSALVLFLSGIGCKQISQSVRSEPVTEGEIFPQTPELQPVPQSETLRFVPPPAPPTESAKHRFTDDDWDQIDQEIAEGEDDEFFPDSSPSMPSSFIRHRGEFSADRLARKGRIAADRREEGFHHPLPIIVSAKPALTRIAGQDPPLLPVPDKK